MKKGLFITCLSIIALLAVLAHAKSLDVLENQVTITLTRGGTETGFFTVKNTGTADLTITITHNLDLIDNDGDEITLTFSDPGTIEPNQSTSVVITAVGDPRIDFETYSGTVTVTDPVTGDAETLSLVIDVQPDLCDFGQVGDDLKMTIENPDPSDDFEPGQPIRIKANVENKGSDDIRVQLEAFLFSDKSEVENAASAVSNINDGDEKDFEFDLIVPLDSRKVREDDEFTLFIKAFDDDNERLNCVQDSVAVDVKLKNKKIIIDDDETRFLPQSAACGDTVIANVHVINVGDKDNDVVTVSLGNQELGISQISDTFSIDRFGSEENNDQTHQFSVKIPQDAKGKTHLFAVNVNFEGGATSKTIPLEVLNCETLSSLLQTGAVLATLTPVDTSVEAGQGSTISIPVKVKNNRDVRDNFIISFTNIGEFATSSQKTITLKPGQESTIFLDMQVNEGASPGTHTAVIEARVEGVVAASETVAIEVKERGAIPQANPVKEVFDALPWEAWIVIDIIIIIVLIITVTTILKNRKH